ncbi:MAG TPA: hypothetical protein VFR87_10580 [Nocardioidaceae bacterium]|nr:hypothetical protein [Nocardioidaceae bacterium]
MYFHLSGHGGVAASVVLLAALLEGCGGSAADDTVSGPGMTDLAPSYDAQPSAEAETGKANEEVRPKGADKPRAERTGATAVRAEPAPSARPAPNRRPRPAQPSPALADPAPVRVSDPAGDLSTSLEGAPASADIVAVQLDRTGATVEVRPVPAGPDRRRREVPVVGRLGVGQLREQGGVDVGPRLRAGRGGGGLPGLSRRQRSACSCTNRSDRVTATSFHLRSPRSM